MEETFMDKTDGKTVLEARAAARSGAVRDRIATLFDAGSFMEIDTLRRDSNSAAGFGTVHGRPVYCFAQDHASAGGAMTQAQAQKAVKLLDMARTTGSPVVMMIDSAGVKVTEGAASLPAYSEIFAKMTRLSGVVPMITVVLGECRGIAALFTQVSDVSIQCGGGLVALHSLQVMNTVKGKPGTEESLFGAETMADQGAVSLSAGTAEEALALAAQVLDALPGCNAEEAPMVDGDDLNRTLTACDSEDVPALIAGMADGGAYLELSPRYGKRVHTVLTHLGGHSVGLVACDHAVENGRLDAASCAKAARFVRMCDCFSLPVVTLVNTDGLEVPQAGAQSWLMRTAGQMLYAYAEATCPKLAVITGSAIGPAYVAMGGKAIADVVYGWENAVIAPLTPEVAAATFEDDKLAAGADRAALENEYRAATSARRAAELGLVDDVIEAADTRKVLIASLEYLSSKRDVNLPRKHGNLPL